jgi:hypothetical protein
VKLSRFYAISQIEYCRNFIFKRNFPIYKLFERGCELGLWRLNKIAEIFGARLRSSARAYAAGCPASSPPSSTRSSMAIMSSVPTSSMPS